MRYVVVGAGAIGAGVGGLLQLAGHDMTLVARGDHLAALRRDGLLLRVGHDEHRLDVRVVGTPAEAAWTEDTVALLGVKSHQTAAAALNLDAAAPAGTPVVSLQNGVSNEPALLRWFEAVHGVTVMMPSSHLRPGEVTVHSAGTPALLDVGSYPGGVDDVDRAVAADLVTAGCASEPRPDIAAWKHRKLLVNLGNGVDAACAEDDDASELTRRCRVEGERVLAAAGIDVVSAEADRDRRGDLLRPLVDREAAGSSTWQSVARGTGATEVDHLNGEIVRLGRLHGVATPANEIVRRTVHDVVRRAAPPRSVSATGLLDLLGPEVGG